MLSTKQKLQKDQSKKRIINYDTKKQATRGLEYSKAKMSRGWHRIQQGRALSLSGSPTHHDHCRHFFSVNISKAIGFSKHFLIYPMFLATSIFLGYLMQNVRN